MMQKTAKAGVWFRKILFLVFAGLFFWFLIPVFFSGESVGTWFALVVCALGMAGCAGYEPLHRYLAAKGKQKCFRRLSHAACILLVAGTIWAAGITGCMIAGVSAQPPDSVKVILTLGCQVRGNVPSTALMARIQATSEYMRQHPDTICIACGGQGDNEIRTEASAIAEYLEKQGIDPGRILQEGRSLSTRENLENALAIMEKNGLGNHAVLITDGYHQFRAGQLARQVGITPYAVSAETEWYIFSACYARELLAITKFFLIG